MLRRSGPRRIFLVAFVLGVIVGATLVEFYWRLPSLVSPTQLTRVPLWGVLMVAYESVLTGRESQNPELAQAMKQALESNPRAHGILSRFLNAYKGLSFNEREALVGADLAKADPSNRLSLDTIRSSVFAHGVAVRQASDLAKSTILPQTILREGSPDKSDPSKESHYLEVREGELIGAEPVEGTTASLGAMGAGDLNANSQSQRYQIDYEGIYVADEDDDWTWSSEYYVVFNMIQGDTVWTKTGGKYGSADSGDEYRRHWYLHHSTSLAQTMYVTAIVIESDWGSMADVADAVQVAGQFMMAVGAISGIPILELVGFIASGVVSVIDGIAWLFGGDVADDQVGAPVAFSLTAGEAEVWASASPADCFPGTGGSCDFATFHSDDDGYVTIAYDIHLWTGNPDD